MAPSFVYGTAWKEDATEACVRAALTAGFAAIDTANQRKHYYEEGVGAAIAGVPRERLWLQTKFTFRDGQDHRLPYDERAPIATQVAQSYAKSLEHLGVQRIDSLILHGPSVARGLGDDDREAWRAMEALGVPQLGVSNVSAEQVAAFVQFARVPIAYVQNRCYASRGWDREVRDICAANGIVYQGFSLLTANRAALASDALRAIAARHRRAPAQIVFRFAQQRGMLPLTGTTNPQHMREDLAISEFSLDERELAILDTIAS